MKDGDGGVLEDHGSERLNEGYDLYEAVLLLGCAILVD